MEVTVQTPVRFVNQCQNLESSELTFQSRKDGILSSSDAGHCMRLKDLASLPSAQLGALVCEREGRLAN